MGISLLGQGFAKSSLRRRQLLRRRMFVHGACWFMASALLATKRCGSWAQLATLSNKQGTRVHRFTEKSSDHFRFIAANCPTPDCWLRYWWRPNGTPATKPTSFTGELITATEELVRFGEMPHLRHSAGKVRSICRGSWIKKGATKVQKQALRATTRPHSYHGQI